MRRAKIVATLGPNQNSYEDIRTLVDEGVDVARFNLSHGRREEHEEKFAWVRQAALDTGRAVAVLLDERPELRSRIVVQVDGGFRTGRDVVIGALLGGFLLKLFGVDIDGAGLIMTFVTALIGACVLLFGLKAISGRR